MDYIDSISSAVVDQDEYREMMTNLPRIVDEVLSYVNLYIKTAKGESVLHPKQYDRKYGYTTLVYFHDILGIDTDTALID